MRKKNILLSMILLIPILLLCSCSNKESIQLEQLKMPNKGEEVVVMTTDLGIIKFRWSL